MKHMIVQGKVLREHREGEKRVIDEVRFDEAYLVEVTVDGITPITVPVNRLAFRKDGLVLKAQSEA